VFNLETFLREEVKPALGCTEPGAVALAVARARRELDPEDQVISVNVTVSEGIYKNGFGVCLPGMGGLRGNALAAALSLLCGNPQYGLEVLKDCNKEHLPLALRWIQDGRIRVNLDPFKPEPYVEATLLSPKHSVTSIIAESHSQIVKVIKDGAVVFEALPSPSRASIGRLLFRDLINLALEADEKAIGHALEAIRVNERIAEYGAQISTWPSANNEAASQGLMCGLDKKDLGYRIRATCYAASYARMIGVKLPVMACAGSGNQGITATLPISVAGQALNTNFSEIGQATIASLLITSYVRSHLGRLSPLCGCVLAAGSGAAAGLTLLMGGSGEQAAEAVKLLLANIAGVLCDGAKETCALKVGTAAHEAYLAAQCALQGRELGCSPSVASGTVEQAIKNVARVGNEGMRQANNVIIEVLENRRRIEQ